MSGSMAYHGGLAAEGSVAADYLRRGFDLVARRWRGSGGEIDLILQDGDVLVFVEVKKSKSFAQALERVSERQIARIFATATEYLAGAPSGQDTDTRFDIALVEASGRIQVMENALGP